MIAVSVVFCFFMRLVSRVLPSPFSVDAAVPGEVAVLASSWGASFLCVRASAHSFSGWIAAAFFDCVDRANEFASAAAAEFDLPFCVVRCCGSWFLVSVPVGVWSFSVVGRSLPCLFVSL